MQRIPIIILVAAVISGMVGCAGAGAGGGDGGANPPPEFSKLLAQDGAVDDNFGESVSINGDYAIVGAPDADGAINGSGAAYIFHRTGTNSWDTGTKLTAYDGEEYDYFGESVSIDGDNALVAGYGNDDNGETSGSMYLFERTGTNSWDSGVKIVSPDGASADSFGTSVSTNGDYALAGASGDDDNGSASGSAYIKLLKYQ